MEIVRATLKDAVKHTDALCELVWSTGAPSYAYHFSERTVFDALVAESLKQAGTLFGWDAMHLAIDDGELLGMVIAFEGPEFRQRQDALASVWSALIEAGAIDADAMRGVIDRSRRASWLNPVVRPRVYYVHAIAVTPVARGRKSGGALLAQAMRDGRACGCRAFELDVLSDNPATGFYRAQGLELLVESRAPDPEAHGVPPEWRMGCSL